MSTHTVYECCLLENVAVIFAMYSICVVVVGYIQSVGCFHTWVIYWFHDPY